MGKDRQKPENAPDSFDQEIRTYVSSLLSDEMMERAVRVDWTRERVLLGLAALQRIRRLWRILFGHAWFSLRAPGDEEMYQRLRSGLLFQLDGSPDYDRVRQTAHDVLDVALPTSDHLVEFDEELHSFYEGRFQRLEAELIRLALADGIDPDIRRAEAFFVTHDDNLNRLQQAVDRAYAERARSLGLASERARPGPSARGTPPRTGRRPAELPYNVAQRVWWEMVEEFESQEEPRRPNQRDLCERLTAKGVQIAERTLRTRIRAWQAGGLSWPPPQPEQ